MVSQKVAMVIHDGVQALDVAGPIDVFAEANVFIAPGSGYQTSLIAASHKPLRTSGGMLISANLTFEEATGGFDIILVAGGPALPDADPDPALLEWLRQAPWRASTYGSICTGAFVLGHAGLLDGHCVTTHWQHAQALADRFPAVRVFPDRIHIRDRRLITSAGVTAGIDLALALVSERHGQAVAVSIAKRLVVVAQRQGGQSQFSPLLRAPENPESPMARVQHFIMANLSIRHTLEKLARVAGMSPRNLARHFVQQTGITPHSFIEQARIDAARALLEATDLPLKVVAFDCGFVTADRMRQIFLSRLGVTPTQYRSSFRQGQLHQPQATSMRYSKV